MKFLSVCSGIEAASVAWRPLGWEAVAFSEIEPFPSAVLAHHYPDVPNLGDMTRFKDWPDATFDVLVGGTPCQSFSVAGLRKGLDDPRGNLALTYLAILDRYRPRWCCWENVPGVLSSGGGRDFGAFLGGLGQLGYGFAYRVLDAQYFGLAQRRKRVFVVGHLGDWRRAAAVLFERESLSGHPAPSREAGQDVTGTLSSRTSAGGGLGTDFDVAGGVVPILEATGRQGRRADARDGLGIGDPGDPMFTLQAGKQHAVASSGHVVGTDFDVAGGLVPQTVSTLSESSGHARRGDNIQSVAYLIPVVANPLTARMHKGVNTTCDEGQTMIAHALRADGFDASKDGTGRQPTAIQTAMQVRRLTPLECCRLQGFPDDYLDIPYRGKPAADGNKYKALGNSMAVPVVRWLGERIALVDDVAGREPRS